jgi:hypothetical protein
MTDDHDFKALVRARMAKTGESYTAARQQLLKRRPGPATPQTFVMPRDGRADEAELRKRQAMKARWYANSQVTVKDDCLWVSLGDPPIFALVVPLAGIKSAARAPDLPPDSKRLRFPASGSRGKWCAVTAATGLVRLEFDPPARARYHIRGAMFGERQAPKTGRLMRPLFAAIARDRSPRVTELIISVDDPDSFIAALDVGS